MNAEQFLTENYNGVFDEFDDTEIQDILQIMEDYHQSKLKLLVLGLHNVVWRSEQLRDYFAWHEEKGYVSHKPSDIDEFLDEQ